MNDSLLTLFVDIVVRNRGLDRELRDTEKRADKTERALSDIGDGAERGSKKAQGAVRGIRDEINDTQREAAKGINLGVDVDDAQVDELTVRLRKLVAGDYDVTVNVDADTAGAIGQLAAVQAAKTAVGRDLTMNVDVDSGGAIAQLVALRAAATAVTTGVQGMGDAVSSGGVRIAMIGSIAATAAALFTPLLGALASLGALAAGAGIGIAGVAGPLLAVVTRLQAYHQSLDQVKSAQSTADSAANSYKSAQEGVQTAVEGVETAERGRTAALDQLQVATEAAEMAQRDLTYALQDEPINQSQATLNLAEARDRATDAAEDYAEAVKKYGANSEEATDADRAAQQATLDLMQAEHDTARIRSDGSDQLQAAMAGEEDATRGVKDAQTALADAGRQVQTAQQAVATAQRAAAQASDQLATAEQGVLDKTIALTPAQQRLYDVAMQFGQAANAAFTGAQDAAARFATAVLRDVKPTFDVLNNVAVADIHAIQFAWQEFVAQMKTPAQMRSTNVLLGISPELVRSLTTTLLNFAMAIANMLAAAAPSALALAGYLERMSIAVLTWSRSAAGANAVKAAIATAVPIFKALWEVILDVGEALFNAGITNSGAVATSIRLIGAALVWLINGFSRLTQAFGPIVPIFTALIPVFLAVALVGSQLFGTLIAFLAPIGSVIAAFATLGVAVIPIVAVIAALAVGVVLLVKNWSKVKAALAPLVPAFNAVKKAVQALATVIKGLLSGKTNTDQFKKAFASLPGPVQTAIKQIVAAMRSLGQTFQKAWTQIRPIVQAIGNGIRKGLGTAFKFIVGQLKQLWNAFRQAWPGISKAVMPVITAIARAVRTALGAAFKFAVQQANVVVKWFRANWPLIQKTCLTVFNAVKSIVTTVLKFIWGQIRTTVGGLVQFWKANWDTIRAIIVSVWNIIKTTISTAIKVVLAIIKATMQIITGDWKGAWETIKGIFSTVWTAIQNNAREAVKILGNVLKLAWEGIKTVAGDAWDAIKGAIGDRIAGILSSIKGFVEDLKGALNSVLDLVGLPGLGDKSSDAKAKRGGGGGRGRRGSNVRASGVGSYAEGGRVTERPGGLYRVAEAGQDEWVLNPKSPNFGRHLRQAAAEGGYRVHRRSADVVGHTPRSGRITGKVKRGLSQPWHAGGAAALGPTMHTYIPEMQDFVDDAEQEFGVYTNTYSNHPPGFPQPYYRERSMDMWAPGGTRGTPLSHEMHAQTVPWTIDRLAGQLNWLISEGRMLTAAGWGPDTSGYNHYNHQHTTAFADDPKAAGDGSGGNLFSAVFDKAWKRFVDPIVGRVLDPLAQSSFVPSKAAGEGGINAVNAIHDDIMSRLGDTGPSGAGGAGLSGTPAENRQLGEKMFPASGLDGSFSSVDAIWTQESGWDETAQNPTSSAFGIPQFLDSTWAAYGGKSFDAEGQIRKGYAYIGDRYSGSADKALAFKEANGWYDTGGMITTQHQALVDPGELYLPLESRQVQRSAQTALGTAELRAMNARNHREMMAKLDAVGLNDPTIRQQAAIARAATVGTLYSRDGLEAHSVNALRADRRDRIASV